MEEILLDSFRWYRTATPDQIRALEEDLLAHDRRDLLIVPDAETEGRYKGILLGKYTTPALEQTVGVRDVIQNGPFLYLSISSAILRGFLGNLSRKMEGGQTVKVREEPSLEDLLQQVRSENPARKPSEQPKPAPKEDDFFFAPAENAAIMRFLKEKPPAQIEAELNEAVIGQRELTRSVADFLYYHALRQVHPELPQRPMLIAGPSGSGKTEVWRVANRLYGRTIPIRVIDGSNMSCEGWSGNYKIDTYMDATIVNGGVLVVDEFDKLTKPKHSASGDNVSLDIQAEFLKLVEGEYCVTDKRKKTNMTSRNMGFVMVGAFESLRREKERRRTSAVAAPRIGFCAQQPQVAPTVSAVSDAFTDEDFIAYGIMPELVGRIATKCSTTALSDADYLNIICGPNSRVAMIRNILRSYGTEVSDLISPEELHQMVATSKSNQTGVRWVSAQVETRLLEAIHNDGLFPRRKAS